MHSLPSVCGENYVKIRENHWREEIRKRLCSSAGSSLWSCVLQIILSSHREITFILLVICFRGPGPVAFLLPLMLSFEMLFYQLKKHANPSVMKFLLLHYAAVVSINSPIKKTASAIFGCRCFPPPSLFLLFAPVSPLCLLFWDFPLLAQQGVRDWCVCVCGGLYLGCHKCYHTVCNAEERKEDSMRRGCLAWLQQSWKNICTYCSSTAAIKSVCKWFMLNLF